MILDLQRSLRHVSNFKDLHLLQNHQGHPEDNNNPDQGHDQGHPEDDNNPVFFLWIIENFGIRAINRSNLENLTSLRGWSSDFH